MNKILERFFITFSGAFQSFSLENKLVNFLAYELGHSDGYSKSIRQKFSKALATDMKNLTQNITTSCIEYILCSFSLNVLKVFRI